MTDDEEIVDYHDTLSFVTSVYDKSFRFRNIAIQEVLDALNLFKPKKSPGLDGLSTRLLKMLLSLLLGHCLIFLIYLYKRLYSPTTGS